MAMLRSYCLVIIMMAGPSCKKADNTPPIASDPGPSSYLNDRNIEFNSVTEQLGNAVVEEGEFKAKAKITPWSSWWYPANQRNLFSTDRGQSPLEKYDDYMNQAHQTRSHATHQEEQLFDQHEVAWAGLCHAWAIASIIEKEPIRSIKKHNVNFQVSDQKALLLKTYENAGNIEIYGQRNNDSRDDIYDDIYPDQFHRFMQYSIFEKQLPFIMDYDPSFPVWSVPVYEINMKITRESNESALVNLWASYASPFVDTPNFVGTKKVVKNYTYRLIGKWEGSQLKVNSGAWMGDSLSDHPDYLIAYPSSVKRQSRNSEIRSEIIDEIIK